MLSVTEKFCVTGIGLIRQKGYSGCPHTDYKQESQQAF